MCVTDIVTRQDPSEEVTLEIIESRLEGLHINSDEWSIIKKLTPHIEYITAELYVSQSLPGQLVTNVYFGMKNGCLEMKFHSKP